MNDKKVKMLLKVCPKDTSLGTCVYKMESNQEERYRIFNRSVSFKEFVQLIKVYLAHNPTDPKCKHLGLVKRIISKNGFDNTESFLNQFIWSNEQH
ncbi:hypothetical protein [Staphylococcus aureus]|uniref:hypothetical protein n=1 Tax=Staphylococcus aureus TaxID=1280 RepID=UPI001BFE3D9C|nr:hypothetical protein [Staphylococcus aureus]